MFTYNFVCLHIISYIDYAYIISSSEGSSRLLHFADNLTSWYNRQPWPPAGTGKGGTCLLRKCCKVFLCISSDSTTLKHCAIVCQHQRYVWRLNTSTDCICNCIKCCQSWTLPLAMSWLITSYGRFVFTFIIENSQYSDENSVRLSVKRVNCGITEEKSVQIFTPDERSFSLVFWEKEWLVARPKFSRRCSR